MLRCLGLALALPVVLPVAAKPRELFEIGKAWILKDRGDSGRQGGVYVAR